jgi:hypothetical protein
LAQQGIIKFGSGLELGEWKLREPMSAKEDPDWARRTPDNNAEVVVWSAPRQVCFYGDLFFLRDAFNDTNDTDCNGCPFDKNISAEALKDRVDAFLLRMSKLRAFL